MEQNEKSTARIAANKLEAFLKLRFSDSFHNDLSESEQLQVDWIMEDLAKELCQIVQKLD